jgi:hypothetical protein
MIRQRRRRRTIGELMVMGLAALAILGFAAWLYGGSYLRQRTQAIQLAREADIAGPPCRSLTEAQFAAQRLKAPKATQYEDAIFARQFGHMECRALRYGGGWGTEVYPVCQFTSPVGLKVTTAKGSWFYALPPGQPATIAVPHGEPRCIAAANFTLERLMRR